MFILEYANFIIHKTEQRTTIEFNRHSFGSQPSLLRLVDFETNGRLKMIYEQKQKLRLELLKKFKLPFCIDRDCSIHTFLRSIAHFKPDHLEQLEDVILRIRESESLKETAKEIDGSYKFALKLMQCGRRFRDEI